jgi:hypothetical protein
MSKVLTIGLLSFVLTCVVSLAAQDVKTLKAGVVRVTAKTPEGMQQTGTGFIVSLTEDAVYIVTDSHVVEGDPHPTVNFLTVPPRSLPVSEVRREEGVDSGRALALLVVRGKSNLPAGLKQLDLGSSLEVTMGNPVQVIGFPGGAESVVNGTISGRRGLDIKVNATLNEGNSGSPVMMTKDNKVVGVVTETEGGFGYARRASDVQTLLVETWGVIIKPPVKSGLTSDFPGGSRRVYSAEFEKWPTPAGQYGAIRLGFGNSYVMRPNSNTWIGPDRMMETPPLNQDFVLDVRFRIESRDPSAVLELKLSGSGTDANAVDLYFELWDENNVTYSLQMGRIRSGGLPVPNVINEETIAEREQLPAAIKSHDWSKSSKLTLKREGGEMQFFVNDEYVKAFGVSLFPVERIHVGAAFPSAIVITSIEARTKN